MRTFALVLADQGVAHGHLTLADILFLAAFIVFLIAAFIAYSVKTFYATLMAVGLALVALGWFLL